MNRIALATVGLLAGLTGATAFLCAQPEAAPSSGARNEAVSRAVLMIESSAFASRDNRHAGDALSVATEAAGNDELGWKYVQLRL